MTIDRGALVRFMTLYAALFSAFGFASPFLPAFLAARGMGAEELGIVLGAALRLACGPIAGRMADRFQIFRAELAACAILAASAGVLYLATQGFWTVMVVSLFQAGTRSIAQSQPPPRAFHHETSCWPPSMS